MIYIPMRILLDLPDTIVSQLTTISARRRVPRAVVVREALDRFLKEEDAVERTSEAAFGAWGDGEDGLAFQRRLRSEW
jgi:metal-responsive CopG/Arc/MetJ family transcriptional regulator